MMTNNEKDIMSNIIEQNKDVLIRLKNADDSTYTIDKLDGQFKYKTDFQRNDDGTITCDGVCFEDASEFADYYNLRENENFN